jgi:hypothetical protein
MRARHFLPEVNMGPTALSNAVKGTEALVGIEYELVMPNTFTSKSNIFSTEVVSIKEIAEFFGTNNKNDPKLTVEYITNLLTRDYKNYNKSRLEEQCRNLLLQEYAFNSNWWLNNKETFINQAKQIIRNPVKTAIEKIAEELFLDWLNINSNEEFKAEAFEHISQADIKERVKKAIRNKEFDDVSEHAWLRRYYDVSTLGEANQVFDFAWPTKKTKAYTPKEIWGKIGNSLSKTLGQPVKTSDQYHGTKQYRGNEYAVEPDGSIVDELDRATGVGLWNIGVEIISPPLPISRAFEDFHKVVKWSKKVKAKTNESTGLHINVSIPELENELDFVKLVLFLGDKHVLEQFHREAAGACASAFEKMEEALSNFKTADVAKMFDILRKGLNKQASKVLHEMFQDLTNRYVSINLHWVNAEGPEGFGLKPQYIEFRSPGGNWLDIPFSQIENTVYRFIYALKIACDPNLAHQEYQKKFFKLVEPLSRLNNDMDKLDAVRLFTMYNSNTVSKEWLLRALKARQIHRELGKNRLDAARTKDIAFLQSQNISSSLVVLLKKWGDTYPDETWRDLIHSIKVFIDFDENYISGHSQEKIEVIKEIYSECKKYWWLMRDSDPKSPEVRKFLHWVMELGSYF